MTVAILTTETPHHAYFVRAMSEICGDVVVLAETAPAGVPPFETRHSFEEKRDRYEWDRWFSGRKTALGNLAPTHAVDTANSAQTIEILRAGKPDLVLVFGTRVLKQPVIDICAGRIFNLHGGDPEEYRGLDTHLWAIFHRDFSGLVTTLHHLDAGLDTGDIILQGSLPLASGMKLHELRTINTELCVALATGLLDLASRGHVVPSRPQRRQGRYYSAMPSSLKEVCQTRFEKFTAGLPS